MAPSASLLARRETGRRKPGLSQCQLHRFRPSPVPCSNASGSRRWAHGAREGAKNRHEKTGLSAATVRAWQTGYPWHPAKLRLVLPADWLMNHGHGPRSVAGGLQAQGSTAAQGASPPLAIRDPKGHTGPHTAARHQQREQRDGRRRTMVHSRPRTAGPWCAAGGRHSRPDSDGKLVVVVVGGRRSVGWPVRGRAAPGCEGARVPRTGVAVIPVTAYSVPPSPYGARSIVYSVRPTPCCLLPTGHSVLSTPYGLLRHQRPCWPRGVLAVVCGAGGAMARERAGGSRFGKRN